VKLPHQPQPTPRQIFDRDFQGFMVVGNDFDVTNNKTGSVTAVPVRMALEITSRTKFLAIFFAKGIDALNMGNYLLNNIGEIFKQFSFI
jgi:hypothetical protein